MSTRIDNLSVNAPIASCILNVDLVSEPVTCCTDMSKLNIVFALVELAVTIIPEINNLVAFVIAPSKVNNDVMGDVHQLVRT